jgi:omega-hydroxy-beta-dihydromenaquinone-9 sulfotransferase
MSIKWVFQAFSCSLKKCFRHYLILRIGAIAFSIKLISQWDRLRTKKMPCARCVDALRMRGFIFPKNETYYDKYWTFRLVSTHELNVWKAAFMLFLKKVTFKYGRRLLLKSAANTARIRILLELFPDARFIHIHRDPYKVFQSTRQFERLTMKGVGLQMPVGNRDARIINRYRHIYEAFFSEKNLIPQGHYCEVKYEECVNDPIGTIKRIYDCLGMSLSEESLLVVTKHIESVRNHQTNAYVGLVGATRDSIRREWRRCFEEWGYPT